MLSRPACSRKPCAVHEDSKVCETEVALGCKWNAERNKCESANELDVGGFSARRTRQAMTALLVSCVGSKPRQKLRLLKEFAAALSRLLPDQWNFAARR